MVVTVVPNINQIKRFAQSALNGFEDLSTENAIENAKGELQNLLLYLDRLNNTNNAVCESFIGSIESEIILKLPISNLDSTNLT